MRGRTITLNVLANINRKMDNRGSLAPRDTILIVFNGSNLNIGSRLEELKKLREKGFEMSIAFSFMGDMIVNKDRIVRDLSPMTIYGEEDVFQLEEIVNKHSKLIMPNITVNTLSKVSLGMIDSFSSIILWTYLYRGKKVYIDFNSARNFLGRETENQAIKNLIDKHIESIKNMGAKELKDTEYIENILGPREVKEGNGPSGGSLNKAQTSPSFKGEVASSSRKVITEKDVLKLGKNAVLKLPKGSIITPLAQDRVKELGIKIER